MSFSESHIDPEGMSKRNASKKRVKDQVLAQTEYIIFRKSQIHGVGGYARKRIKEGTSIIEYLGQKVDKKKAARLCEEENSYIFVINDDYDLDGSVDWNLAKWINHSCEPNCEALDEEGRIWITAYRDIKPGEELTFNYNYDLEEYGEHPCCCGSEKCVGYIVAEEHFEEVRKRHTAPAQATA